ncbi:hypothetical protein Clacol_010294 [Clathrus columnatus]|uniref:tRNA pseudouridine(55) synthase n=1 Tax=Clathrus columnatus TaxID=1419009 RepID=A0AAV5AVV2_9AGAM|nr:hypothetical protein Clacol_010294 [Clathrus columnatus]
MPKVGSSTVNCLFGIIKPSGPASMSVVNSLKPLLSSSSLFYAENLKSKKGGNSKKFSKRSLKHMIKIGTGGTLDPLADGVLVLGIGEGTKQLGKFLDCVKEYQTTCLLGCETDTYDSQGIRVREAPWSHVTRTKIEQVLDSFRGEIMQTPPIFSALKMDGRPLYEYAREGIPLPKPIPPRKVTVHSLEVVDWLEGHSHQYQWPEKTMSATAKQKLKQAVAGITGSASSTALDDDPDPKSSTDDTDGGDDDKPHPPAFILKMTVSGGTYVRSIAHDIGHAVGSAAYVVTLTRLRQGDFTLSPEKDRDKSCVPWEVFEQAIKENENDEETADKDEQGHRKWENEVLDKLVLYEPSNSS